MPGILSTDTGKSILGLPNKDVVVVALECDNGEDGGGGGGGGGSGSGGGTIL